MTKNLATDLNFTRLCRCCALEHDLMYDVFYGTCSSAQTYREVIMECAPVQLFRDDGLPSLVCHECVLILESLVVFRKKCVESELIFKRMSNEKLNSNQIKRDSSMVDNIKEESNEFDDPEKNSASVIYPELVLCNEIKIENTSDTNSHADRSESDSEVDRQPIENFVGVKEELVDGHDSVYSRHTTHDDRKAYACDACTKTFTKKSNLDRHRSTHTGETPYACDECAKSFNRRDYLVKHRKTHTGERPYSCDACTKSYANKWQLDEHRNVHTGEKPHACGECAKSFYSKSNLFHHQRLHTGERSHACDTCAKSFRSTSNLNQHRKTHTGERPYACARCGKSFADKSNLNRHAKRH